MLLFLAIKNISLMLCFWAWSIRYMRAGWGISRGRCFV